MATRRVKWQLNSVQQYSGTVGSNSAPFPGMAAMDITQIMEATPGEQDWQPTGFHRTIVLPTDDLDDALLMNNSDMADYMITVIAWMLDPAGWNSPNISADRLEAAEASVDAFNARMTQFGGLPVKFTIPGDS